MSTKQITARLPLNIYKKVMEETSTRNITITDLVVESLMQYFGEDVPGLCPKCHKQNRVDANFCDVCGTPLTQDARLEQEFLDKTVSNPDFILKLADKLRDLVENQ